MMSCNQMCRSTVTTLNGLTLRPLKRSIEYRHQTTSKRTGSRQVKVKMWLFCKITILEIHGVFCEITTPGNSQGGYFVK